MFRKKSEDVLVIARQHFGFLRHGQPLSDSGMAAGESLPSARDGVAAKSKRFTGLARPRLAGL